MYRMCTPRGGNDDVGTLETSGYCQHFLVMSSSSFIAMCHHVTLPDAVHLCRDVVSLCRGCGTAARHCGKPMPDTTSMQRRGRGWGRKDLGDNVRRGYSANLLERASLRGRTRRRRPRPVLHLQSQPGAALGYQHIAFLGRFVGCRLVSSAYWCSFASQEGQERKFHVERQKTLPNPSSPASVSNRRSRVIFPWVVCAKADVIPPLHSSFLSDVQRLVWAFADKIFRNRRVYSHARENTVVL
jgi:hypothetical protein